MSLKPQLARTAAVVENADVQGVASVLYDYLRTLFTGDTVLYNYPTGGVGKLVSKMISVKRVASVLVFSDRAMDAFASFAFYVTHTSDPAASHKNWGRFYG